MERKNRWKFQCALRFGGGIFIARAGRKGKRQIRTVVGSGGASVSLGVQIAAVRPVSGRHHHFLFS